MASPDPQYKDRALYAGRNIPIEALSPSEFENFVFGALGCIQDTLGFDVTGVPSGSGDGGFDVQGQRTGIHGRGLVCVQCKRQVDSLSLPQVAREFAKVACTSRLEGSSVVEHRFICTGGVARTVRSAFREQARSRLVDAVVAEINSDSTSELVALRMKIDALGYDPSEVVAAYVQNLDRIIAWDMAELDAALSPRWSKAMEVMQRYFRIESVVLAHPRAFFDRSAYLDRHRTFQLSVEPRIRPCNLPPDVAVAHLPEAPCEEAVAWSRESVPGLLGLGAIPLGGLALMVGMGGIGKSSTLKLLRRQLIEEHGDSVLPIILRLVHYTPQTLDNVIHQELGVLHGSWRTLPDRVVLLCDGINECPVDVANKFLDEVGRLLQQKKVACIIALRDTLPQTIIFPRVPDQCVALELLTPAGIRRIANDRLEPASITAFLDHYRAKADMAGSAFFWTPFAVEAALAIWKDRHELPTTLGAMIDAFLLARTKRNLDQPGLRLEVEVVRRLASELAYQALVVDGVLEYTPSTAGGWIERARQGCRDALGIADLGAQAIVAHLTAQEVLKKSEQGSYRFSHQLLAGALATDRLASNWRNHLGALKNPASDDAWVFSASKIPPEDRKNFLENLFKVDLSLSARAARELPSVYQDWVVEALSNYVTEDHPEFLRIKALFSLAVIGGRAAQGIIRGFANDATSPVQYPARAALAASGDESYLQYLLIEAEKVRSLPMTISGGELSIWESAPLHLRLDLARRRASQGQPGELVAESLLLLAFEKDPDDVDLIESHLASAKDFRAWQYALYALNQVAPSRAEKTLDLELKKATSYLQKCRLLKASTSIGMPLRVDEAVHCALQASLEDLDEPMDRYQIDSFILEAILPASLSTAAMKLIEEQLAQSEGEVRRALWLLAQGCPVRSIADYALDRILHECDDAWSACRYFIRQPGMVAPHKASLVEASLRRLVQPKDVINATVAAHLALLGDLGLPKEAISYLIDVIEVCHNIRLSRSQDRIAELSPREQAFLDCLHTEHVEIALAMELGGLLPIIAKARHQISSANLLSLLHFSFSTKGNDEDLLLIVSGIADEEIDDELPTITHWAARLPALVAACSKGCTPRRIEQLARELRDGYRSPQILNAIEAVIERCWSAQVLAIVLDAVSSFDSWSENEGQFFWKIVRTVARRVCHEDSEAIRAAQRVAKTDFAMRILGLWESSACGDRIGLSLPGASTMAGT